MSCTLIDRGEVILAAESQVIVDTVAAAMDTVYCGIGRSDRMLEIGLRDPIRVVRAQDR